MTLSRILLAIPAGVLLSSGQPGPTRWGIFLFLAAALSDLADGWAARTLNQISDVGKALDPLADKMALGSLFIALSVRFGLPPWFLVIYLGKEFLQIIMAAIFIRAAGRPNAASTVGKASSTVLYAGATMFYIGAAVWPPARVPGLAFLIIGLLLAFIAAAGYLAQCLKQVKTPPGSPVKGEL